MGDQMTTTEERGEWIKRSKHGRVHYFLDDRHRNHGVRFSLCSTVNVSYANQPWEGGKPTAQDACKICLGIFDGTAGKATEATR